MPPWTIARAPTAEPACGHRLGKIRSECQRRETDGRSGGRRRRRAERSKLLVAATPAIPELYPSTVIDALTFEVDASPIDPCDGTIGALNPALVPPPWQGQ